MDLNDAYKKWQENPENVCGKPKPRRWIYKLKAHENRRNRKPN